MVGGYSVVRVDTGPHHTVCCVEAAAAAQVGEFFGGVIGVGEGVLEEMQDAVGPPLVLLSLSKDPFDRVPRSVAPHASVRTSNPPHTRAGFLWQPSRQSAELLVLPKE